ncbi:hypothetical protein BLA29_010870 [Euroglyphus maynei]|uniref:Uncharacterized protein n=1 Tax=Euroglyphus maynei TaxID=6958 RepID=A0A1Y3BJX4_EURMA|nr:hypothetical protein BLA29_010870 [Euroglyphus maynei]
MMATNLHQLVGRIIFATVISISYDRMKRVMNRTTNDVYNVLRISFAWLPPII